MVIAYIRVSTEKQNVNSQKASIKNFAKLKNIHIDKWHSETVSGAKLKDNRKLGKILDSLSKDDIVIVSEISRLSRKMLEIMTILGMCIEKDITIYSVKEGFKLGNDINSKIMGFAFGISAEIEKSLISARTKEALAYKKSQGITLGRPIGSSPKMNLLAKNRDNITQMLKDNIPINIISKKYGISRGTLYSFLKESITSNVE